MNEKKGQWAYNHHTFARFYLPTIFEAQNHWNAYDYDIWFWHAMHEIPGNRDNRKQPAK